MIAIAIFMLVVFVIDVFNLYQHTQKEEMKLELRTYYNKDKKGHFLKRVLIYGEALLEIFLTQLNLFDIYTDFAFLTITAQDENLTIFFVMSLISFSLTMVPKLYSYYLIF